MALKYYGVSNRFSTRTGSVYLHCCCIDCTITLLPLQKAVYIKQFFIHNSRDKRCSFCQWRDGARRGVCYHCAHLFSQPVYLFAFVYDSAAALISKQSQFFLISLILFRYKSWFFSTNKYKRLLNEMSVLYIIYVMCALR